MKYCTKCGAPVDDAAVFCTACGSAMEASPAAAPAAPAAPAYTAPTYAPAAAYNNTAAVAGPTDGRGILAKSSAGVMFLVAVIAQTAAAALSLINGFIPESKWQSSSSYVGGIIGTLLAQTVPVIMCVMLWLLWAKARKATADSPLSSGPISTLKVCSILQLVGNALLGLLFILCGVLCFAGGSFLEEILGDMLYDLDFSYGYAKSLFAFVGVLLLLIGIGYIAITVCYWLFTMKMCNAAIDSVRTNEVPAYISMFVPIWNFVGAGFMLLTLFSGAMTTLIGLCTITANVMFGIVILQYRGACTQARLAAQVNAYMQ